MDHVLVKVKGLRRKPYFKLMSDHTLYEPITVDLNACVPYDPDHNLDEEAWFKITDFSKQPYCLDFINQEFDSKDYGDLTKEQFTKIAFLFAVQGDDFYFQKITPSLFVKKKMIAFGEVAEIEEVSSRLVINKYPDAVYFKNADTLIFQNLSSITSIFTGIDVLFKEATNEQVQEFLDHPFVELDDDYDISKVSTPNRKRIAMAMAKFDVLNDDQKNEMFDYIHDYCDDINFDNEAKTFSISTDEELKYLLYGIDQRFYTTPLSHEKRLANSVLTL